MPETHRSGQIGDNSLIKILHKYFLNSTFCLLCNFRNGCLTIQGNNGSCTWAGTGTVNVSSDTNGMINVNFGHKVYDTFVLLSHSKISQ